MMDGSDSFSKSHHLSFFFNQATLQHCLKTLIDSAREYWSYAIFWQSSLDDYGGPTVLGWGAGYYKGEKDEGRRKDPGSSSPVEEQVEGPQGSADDAFDEEVPDTESFFLISMDESFVNGSGLPGQALCNASPVWVTGAERLASSHCKRTRQAQGFGIQTLVCIPLEDGVVELGSSALIFPHSEFDLLDRVKPLFNFRNTIFIQEIDTDSAGSSSFSPPIQPGYESESSVGNYESEPSVGNCESEPSVGNCPMFQRGDSSSQREKRTRSNSDSDSGSRYLEVFTQILKRAKG